MLANDELTIIQAVGDVHRLLDRVDARYPAWGVRGDGIGTTLLTGEDDQPAVVATSGEAVVVRLAPGRRGSGGGGDRVRVWCPGEDPASAAVRGRLEAKLTRPVFYELVDLAEPSPDDPDMLGVWSQGAFFPLGPAG